MGPLTLERQERLLRYRFPKAEVWYRESRGYRFLCFRVPLQPTPTSETYTVMYAYALGERPLVWVEDPKPVTEAHGEPTPHFNGDGTLCLYDGTADEWDPSDAIVYTTIPWTQRWLFHYEHWLTFGEWRGDSPSDPGAPKPAEVDPPEQAELQ